MAFLRLTSNIRMPGPFPANRVCTHESCETILSRYNGNIICHAHEHLHLDEPAQLRLDHRFLPNEAVRDLVMLG